MSEEIVLRIVMFPCWVEGKLKKKKKNYLSLFWYYEKSTSVFSDLVLHSSVAVKVALLYSMFFAFQVFILQLKLNAETSLYFWIVKLDFLYI